jgi:hypothetical protein
MKSFTPRPFLSVAAGLLLVAPAPARAAKPNPMVMAHNLTTTGSQEHLVISGGGQTGPYQAFPDAARLADGSITSVFYDGYGHVSLPKSGWEKGGRICMVTSTDEGSTWTAPRIIFDDPRDNRDPHIAQLSNGTLVCTFFSLMPKTNGEKGYQTSGTEMITSTDGGKTWDATARVIAPDWYVSAPVRQLRDGTCILGLYHFDQEAKQRYGGVTLSSDLGKTWSEPIPIGKGQPVPLDAETDVIELRDGRIFAALRSSEEHMRCAYSSDGGKTWTPVQDIGFRGHAPHLLRLSTGEILLTHRLPDTALHVSRDETATWQGPYLIDAVRGAYPSSVELRDGTILVIYYTEGAGSRIRARRFRLTDDGPEFLPLTK